MIHYELSPLRECLQEAAAFRNANRPLARDLSYFNWRYLERPCAAESLIAWAREAQQPVAAATVAPHDFSVCGRATVFGIVGDISVSSSHRGSGLGKDLLSFVATSAAERNLSCLVLPNAPALSSLRKAGWQSVCDIERYVRILRARRASLTQPKQLLRWGMTTALAGGLRIVDTLAARRRAHTGLSRQMHADAEFDRLWDRLPKAHLSLALRTAPYLQWRYLKHPLQEYQLLGFRTRGELRGYIVTHDEQGSCVVDDYALENAEDATPFCVELISWASEHGHSDIHVRSSTPAQWDVPWSSFGFFKRNDPIVVMGSQPHRPNIGERSFLTLGDKDV